MKVIFCARLTNWPIDRSSRRRRPDDAPAGAVPTGAVPAGTAPRVLVRTAADRQVVVAACDAAEGQGIRPGMTLAQARALCSTVAHAEHETHRDATALRAVARWLTRFSPCVALATIDDAPAGGPPAAGPPTLILRMSKFVKSYRVALPGGASAVEMPGLWLDLTGTRRLLGPPDRVAATVLATLRRWGVRARGGLAATPGAAWAMTFDPFAPASPQADPTPDLFAHPLDDRPVVALRLPADIVTVLHHLGLFSIGQLRRLPRDQLPARFGPWLNRRLDQLDGRLDEPLVPVPPAAPIVERYDFDEPVSDLAPVLHVLEGLTARLTARLARRGLGARELRVDLHRPGREPLPPVVQTVRLSRPTRDVRRIGRLIACAAEKMTAGVLPATARSVSSRARRKPRPAGRRLTPAPVEFCRVVLSVVAAQRVADEQVSLLGADAAASAAELDDLVERLAVRLGRQGVMRIRPVESYLPEKAFAPLDWDAASGTAVAPSCPPRIPPRPFRLFPPTELRVIVSPSHDRDGRPVSLATLRSGAMRSDAMQTVVHAVGPERIAGQWWTGHDKSRDYFDIELPDGRRWWVFRVNETGRWFWQGEY